MTCQHGNTKPTCLVRINMLCYTIIRIFLWQIRKKKGYIIYFNKNNSLNYDVSKTKRGQAISSPDNETSYI